MHKNNTYAFVLLLCECIVFYLHSFFFCTRKKLETQIALQRASKVVVNVP